MGSPRQDAYEIAMQALDEAEARRTPTAPVELDAEYFRLLAYVESLPENASGTDKTWMERARREFREYYESVRRGN